MAAPITSRTNGHNLVLLIQARFLHQFNRVPCLKFFLPEPSGPSFFLYKDIHHTKNISDTFTLQKIELKIKTKSVEIFR
jgi:hypothetical protein